MYPTLTQTVGMAIIPRYHVDDLPQCTSTPFFIDAPKPLIVKQLGEDIPTLPLKFGKRFSLLGMSQNDKFRDTGTHSHNDAVYRPSPRLEELVFMTEQKQFIAMPVRWMRSGDFQFRSQPAMAHAPEQAPIVILSTGVFRANILINNQTRDIYGERILPWKAEHCISMDISLHGSIHLTLSDTEVNILSAEQVDHLHNPLTLVGYTLNVLRHNPTRVGERPSYLTPLPPKSLQPATPRKKKAMATKSATPDEGVIKTDRVFEVFQKATAGQWYWHAKARANGKITLRGEGHPTSAKAVRAIVQELAALGATAPTFIEVKGDKPTFYSLNVGNKIEAVGYKAPAKVAAKFPAKAVTGRTKVSVVLPKNTKDPMAAVSKIQDDIVAAKTTNRAEVLKTAKKPFVSNRVSATVKPALNTGVALVPGKVTLGAEKVPAKKVAAKKTVAGSLPRR